MPMSAYFTIQPHLLLTQSILGQHLMEHLHAIAVLIAQKCNCVRPTEGSNSAEQVVQLIVLVDHIRC